jgi:hypothetical protein
MKTMHATEIIRILLDRARENPSQEGRQVSFTVSGLQRDDYVERQVARFFQEKFNVRLVCGGKKNERHFTFTLVREMLGIVAIEIKPTPSRATRYSNPTQLAFA